MLKMKPLFKFIFFFIIIMTCFCSESWAFKKACPSLDEFITEGSGGNCLLCSLYEYVFDLCKEIVELAWNSFAESLQSVVALGTAIYVAVFTLKNIGNFSQQDTGAYLSNDKTGIIPLMVKAAAVIWLLSDEGNTFLYSHLIGPVISDGLDIGSQLSSGGSLGASSGMSSASGVGELFDAVIIKMEEFNDSIYTVIAMGDLLWCLSFLPDGLADAHWGLAVSAFGIMVMGWLILIGVSFFLLDVVFRLAIACILLPFAVACGMSKLTSNYTKKNWNLFVNVFFSFVIIGVLIVFTIKMIEKAITADPTLQARLASGILNNSDAELIAEEFDVTAFLLLCLACTISFKLFLEIDPIVDKISNSKSVGSTGKKMGEVAGKTALAPVKAAGKFTVGATVGTIEAGAESVGKFIATSKPGMAVRGAMRKLGTVPDKLEKKIFGTSQYD